MATSIRLTHGLERAKEATTSAGDPTTAPPTTHAPQEAYTAFSPERAAETANRTNPMNAKDVR